MSARLQAMAIARKALQAAEGREAALRGLDIVADEARTDAGLHVGLATDAEVGALFVRAELHRRAAAFIRDGSVTGQ